LATALALGLAGATEFGATTTVYTLEGVAKTGDCAELDLPSADVKPAQGVDKNLIVGHCADKGFSVADGTATKKVPVLGNITVRKYKKAGGENLADTTTVYTLEGVAKTGDCAELDLPSADVKPAQGVDKNLIVGHCADKGFSVADGTATKKVPVLGNITVRKYKKAANVHEERRAQIEEIQNTPGVLWTAAPQERFASEAPGASKHMMGVKGDWRASIEAAIASGKVERFQELTAMAVPTDFDSETNWPKCAKIIGDIRDQSNCGCCWAFGAAEAASDRMCIASDAKLMLPLSAQDVCFTSSDDGCDGGDINSPWDYISETGAVTGGQYQGTGPFGKGLCLDFSLPHCHHHGPQGKDPYPAEGAAGCPSEHSPATPKKCDADAEGAHSDFKSDKYTFSGQTQSAQGPSQIKQAIMTGGPVETAFTVYSDFENYAGGIYHHVSGSMAGGHAVKIVGWGVESGTKYWKVANSWNPYWGEKGYFRIKEGEGGIDDQVTFSPAKATWSKKGDNTVVV